ncbi:MAG: hypothetical protein K0S45_3859 [Nitrospira sp.]|nr:hypothetical protein [Nitrospira sp.]
MRHFGTTTVLVPPQEAGCSRDRKFQRPSRQLPGVEAKLRPGVLYTKWLLLETGTSGETMPEAAEVPCRPQARYRTTLRTRLGA